MLKFEFVQPGEFDDPYYSVIFQDMEIAKIIFYKGYWKCKYDSIFVIAQHDCISVGKKLTQLNKDL